MSFSTAFFPMCDTMHMDQLYILLLNVMSFCPFFPFPTSSYICKTPQPWRYIKMRHQLKLSLLKLQFTLPCTYLLNCGAIYMHIFMRCLNRYMHLQITDGCILLGMLISLFYFSLSSLFLIFYSFNSKHFPCCTYWSECLSKHNFS